MSVNRLHIKLSIIITIIDCIRLSDDQKKKKSKQQNGLHPFHWFRDTTIIIVPNAYIVVKPLLIYMFYLASLMFSIQLSITLPM